MLIQESSAARDVMFLSIDGCDGTGKSTQVERLRDWLQSLGRDVVTWYVMIVDAGGNQISPQVQIQFDPDMANGYRVDWQRTY